MNKQVFTALCFLLLVTSKMRFFTAVLVFLSVQLSFGQNSPLISDTNYVYKSLAVAMQDPEHVYKLDLSKHKLKEIPADVFKLTNLRELNLSKNRLTTLPAAIGRLTALQRLSLANNDIDTLPDEIGNLQNLIYLGLNRNVVTELPAGIGDLQKLEVLELWDNEVAVIPEEISRLKNLQVLELRGILFSEEDQARIHSLLPNTTIYFSPSCPCKF